MNVEAPDPAGTTPSRPRPPSLAFDDAFAFLFRTPGGVSTLLIGGVLLLLFWLVVPGLVVIGYGVALGRAVALGRDELPRFRLGQVVDGFKAGVVMLLYSLPIFVIYAAAMLPAFLAALGREEFATPSSTFQFFALFWLLMIYGFAMAFLQPAIFATFIARGTIASCFSVRRLGDVIRYWRGSYVAAAAIIFGLSQLAGLGVILLVIGIAFTAFYHVAFTSHISGQLARPLMGELPSGRFIL
jgi:hypothetical protein